MKTLTLSVKDRLLLPPLLPHSGGRIEMMLVDALAKKVEFTMAEISAFELQDTPSGVKGNPIHFADKAIELTPEQIRVLRDIPARLDKQGDITRDLLPLLDKIDAL